MCDSYVFMYFLYSIGCTIDWLIVRIIVGIIGILFDKLSSDLNN